MHHVLFEGHRAVGVSVESGGEMFGVYGDEIIVCGGGNRLTAPSYALGDWARRSPPGDGYTRGARLAGGRTEP